MAYSKRKEFAPMGKFFPFKVKPYSEGMQNKPDKVTSPESILIPLEYS